MNGLNSCFQSAMATDFVSERPSSVIVRITESRTDKRFASFWNQSSRSKKAAVFRTEFSSLPVSEAEHPQKSRMMSATLANPQFILDILYGFIKSYYFELC